MSIEALQWRVERLWWVVFILAMSHLALVVSVAVLWWRQ